MTETPPSGLAFIAALWTTVIPILWFLSGSAGFFYEVFKGHNLTWGVACALWAAGGPALAAQKMMKGL